MGGLKKNNPITHYLYNQYKTKPVTTVITTHGRPTSRNILRFINVRSESFWIRKNSMRAREISPTVSSNFGRILETLSACSLSRFNSSITKLLILGSSFTFSSLHVEDCRLAEQAESVLKMFGDVRRTQQTRNSAFRMKWDNYLRANISIR